MERVYQVFGPLRVKGETQRAFLVDHKHIEFWLPKSQIHSNSIAPMKEANGKYIEIFCTVNEWILKKKGVMERFIDHDDDLLRFDEFTDY
jgi:hypothetical protein